MPFAIILPATRVADLNDALTAYQEHEDTPADQREAYQTASAVVDSLAVANVLGDFEAVTVEVYGHKNLGENDHEAGQITVRVAAAMLPPAEG